MLPKNSTSRTYVISKGNRTLKSTDKTLSFIEEWEQERAEKERSRAAAAAQKTAERMAAAVVRKSGARTLADQEAVRRRHFEKNERVAMGFDYKKMVMESNTNNTTNQLSYGEIALNAKATKSFDVTEGKRYGRELGEVGSKNRSFGKLKAQSQCKRCFSFEEDDDYFW